MFCGNLKALFCGNSNCSQNILGEGLTFFFHVEKVISQSRFGGRGEGEGTRYSFSPDKKNLHCPGRGLG